MFHPQLAVERRKEGFDSPVDYVMEIIPFTFVRSWINLPPFWKVLQLLHLHFQLVFRGSLQSLSLLPKRMNYILLLSMRFFLSLALLSLFLNDHWSKRLLTWLHCQSFILLLKRIMIRWFMFFSSCQILLSTRMILLSQMIKRVLPWFLSSRGEIIRSPHQVVRLFPLT